MKKLMGVLLVVSAAALAQQVVDQGAPGKKGPWPVSVSGITIMFDGGITIAPGTVIVATGPDGGAVQVNITQSIPLTVTTVSADGGTVSAIPVQCRSTALDGGSTEQNTSVGVAAVQVPTSPSVGRVYVNICNSAQNASTAIVKCRQDGVAPVFAAGNPGQVLLFGDCMLSTAPTTTNEIRCIADAASRNVTTYECVPL